MTLMHTATYKGKLYTLHTKGFCRLIGRSSHFVYARLSKAELAGRKDQMQYVIEQSEYMLANEKVRKVKRPLTRLPSVDNNRQRREERYLSDKESLINGFLYPAGVLITGKREGLRG